MRCPDADESKPRISTVAVLKRAEKLNAEEQKDQPFRFGELLVYPNLGETVKKSVTKELAFFITAWPAKGSQTPLKLTLQILQNNKPLGQTSADLPAPDAQGQIKYASAIPLDKFQPGVFELKVTVSDGKNNVSRSTEFTLGRLEQFVTGFSDCTEVEFSYFCCIFTASAGRCPICFRLVGAVVKAHPERLLPLFTPAAETSVKTRHTTGSYGDKLAP